MNSQPLRTGMIASLDRGVVPLGIEEHWDDPRISRRFGKLSVVSWPINDRKSHSVRVSRDCMEAGVEVARFRTLRTIWRLSTPAERNYVPVQMVILAELVEGTQASEVLEDLEALRNCNALEFGEEST